MIALQSQDLQSFPAGAAWHVVYTSPSAELKAVQAVRAAGSDMNATSCSWPSRFDAYAPLERRNHKRKPDAEVTSPVFSRYIFVAFDPYVDPWQRILDADGVEDVLRTSADNPGRIPTVWVEALRRTEEGGGFDRRRGRTDAFDVGEIVRVVEGPFAGLNATVQTLVRKLRSATATKRIKVLMNFLGGPVMMEMPLQGVEKL